VNATLSVSLLAGVAGYEVHLAVRGQTRSIGRVESSGDPSFPWRTSAGHLEADATVAALKLAAHVLEDEHLALVARLR